MCKCANEFLGNIAKLDTPGYLGLAAVLLVSRTVPAAPSRSHLIEAPPQAVGTPHRPTSVCDQPQDPAPHPTSRRSLPSKACAAL